MSWARLLKRVFNIDIERRVMHEFEIYQAVWADGKKIEVKGCDVVTFKNRKIAVKSYFQNRTA